MFTRTFKSLIARICVAVVLFAQLAISAYACEPAQHQSAGAALAIEHAGMEGCEHHAPPTTNLCHEHCQAGNQSAEMPSFAVPPAAVIYSILPELDRISPASLVKVVHSLLARASHPPPLILFQVFRI